MNRLKTIRTKRTLFGIGFGLLFPIFATLLDIWLKGNPISLQSALDAQSQNPIHWIVDSAPLFLGIAFHIVGMREAALSDSNAELKNTVGQMREIQSGLEQRVEERTHELSIANTHNEKRARQFEAIARVSQTISEARNFQDALARATDSTSLQFGFYHTGIYLLNEKNESAVLHASSSRGGLQMISQGHRVGANDAGIIGQVIRGRAPRIAQDIGHDAVHFNNPDLPATRSEIALPLKLSGRIIGVLDIQSVEPSAFSNEDITILSVLADQVSITLENIRLIEEARTSLDENITTDRKYIQKEWKRLAQEEKLAGFQFIDGTSFPLETPLEPSKTAGVVSDGKIHQTEAAADGRAAQLAVPVKLRGEVIGILQISMPDKARWTDDDIDIAEAVAERLALSIENARLFQASASRAVRERVISEISSKISGNIRVENILRTTAQELSLALHGSNVLIQLQTVGPSGEVQK